MNDFSYMSADHAANCNLLQQEVASVLATGVRLSGDELLNTAADNLGNDDERFCGFVFCKSCGEIFHRDYTEAEGDFCDSFCAVE